MIPSYSLLSTLLVRAVIVTHAGEFTHTPDNVLLQTVAPHSGPPAPTSHRASFGDHDSCCLDSCLDQFLLESASEI